MKKKKNNSFLGKIKNFFSNLREKYNKLTKNSKTVLWLWVVITLIIIIIIALCSSNNKVTTSHEKIEQAMTKAAEKYGEDKDLHGTKDQKVRISMDELIDSKNLKEKDITDDTCIGYSLYYSVYDKKGKEQIKVKSYLSCKKYTTEGYKNE